MIVAVLNQKGGVGKTTLAMHIAGELSLRGQEVIVLDADPQGSSLDWTQRRSQLGLPRLFGAVGLARETLHQEAPELGRRADHFIIDGPPRIAALARSVLLAAGRVLIAVQPSPYGARLTLNVMPAKRACIKQSVGFNRRHDGSRTAVSRASGKRPMSVQITGATMVTASAGAPPLGAPPRQTGAAPLTRVLLSHIAQRLDLYLRFGDALRTVRLDRWHRVAMFPPQAVFCRIHWQGNDYGTKHWQLLVLQACTPLDMAQRIAGVLPGARLLLRAEGAVAVRAVLLEIDSIEASAIALPAVCPAYWRMLGNRLQAHLSLPRYTPERHGAWLARSAFQ